MSWQNLKQYWRDKKKSGVTQWRKGKPHLGIFYIWFMIFPEQSGEVWQLCFWSTATNNPPPWLSHRSQPENLKNSPTRLQDGIMLLACRLNTSMHYSIDYLFHLSITFLHYLWNHDPLTSHRPDAQKLSESSDLRASSLLSECSHTCPWCT